MTYGRTLANLRDLQLLEWNYYDGDGDMNVYGGWDMVSEERLAEIALQLAHTCRSLRKVNFCLFVDGLMGVSVVRDNGHTDTRPPLYSESWGYCTSAWKTEIFSDI